MGYKGKKNLPFDYFPGSHLVFYKEKKDKTFISRNYTISSAPTESKKWIEITVKKEADGFISKFIHKNLKEEIPISIRAPMGDRVLNKLIKDPKKEFVFISGGIGITPMRSFAKFILDNGFRNKINFIHSEKKFDDLVFYEELKKWVKDFSNFKLNITLTRENNSHLWEGEKGRLSTKKLRHILSKNENKEIFLCGSNGFSSSIQKILEELKIPKSQIRIYSFGSRKNPREKTKQISPEELLIHNNSESAWISFEGKVYDLTEYVNKHPGGEILLDYAGKDITDDFHLVGHSGKARMELDRYYIGKLNI